MANRIQNSPKPGLDIIAALATLNLNVNFSVQGNPTIGNGGTAGNLRTTASTGYTVAGVAATLGSTDDHWDLSGETDTAAAMYRAYWLHHDGTFSAGSDVPTAASALASLPTPVNTKSILGVYVAGPATDFDDAGGLAAQGDIYNGIPAGCNIGVTGRVSLARDILITG